MKNIYIASDHGGFRLKSFLVEKYKNSSEYNFIDLGTNSLESCDYPIYAKKLCEKVIAENTLGILICGTGIGMSMAANKHKGIRAALCAFEFQGRMTKAHNNASVLCLGERVTGEEVAFSIVEGYLNTPIEAGRHQKRIDMF